VRKWKRKQGKDGSSGKEVMVQGVRMAQEKGSGGGLKKGRWNGGEGVPGAKPERGLVRKSLSEIYEKFIRQQTKLARRVREAN